MTDPTFLLDKFAALGIQTLLNATVVLALTLLLIIFIALRLGRRAAWRDPQRFFTWTQKRQLIAQAGGRCEHKSVVWRRCSRPGTEADHVVPWSRGGRTVVENGQLLCRTHNTTKSNYMPNALYHWRLRQRRKKYRS